MRSQFGAESIRIGFQRQHLACWADDLVLIDRTFLQSGNEKLPDTRGAPRPHHVYAAVPMIEIADHTDAFGAGSPHRKIYAANLLDGLHMSAKLFIRVVMAAFAHEIQVKFAEKIWERIRVIHFKRFAVVGAPLNFVTAGSGSTGLVRRPQRLEEALRTQFHGVRDFHAVY